MVLLRLVCSLIISMFGFAVTGCTNSIPIEQTVIKNGIAYRIGSDRPYSGVVTGKEKRKHFFCTLKYRKKFRNGILDGVSEYYYLNGKPASIEPYVNGYLNGIVTQYYQDGQVKYRIHVKEGDRSGDLGEKRWLRTLLS